LVIAEVTCAYKNAPLLQSIWQKKNTSFCCLC